MKPTLQYMALSLALAAGSLHGAEKIVNEGERVTISYGLGSGTPPFKQQWTKDGADIPGATAETLVIISAKAADAGTYRVKVSNSAGVTVSDNASISIVVRPAKVETKIASETPPANP